MRIAVPTNDGVTLSEHFGRSAAFLIFELENGRITKRETRPNRAHHAAADGECHHGGEGEGHSHAGILPLLAGCDVVRCGGMGGRAAEALKAGGISPVPVSASGSAEELVAAYVAGTLITPAASFCRCSH
jgi:predicted Fe-Mo cluster-binding NifX family protein